MCFVSIEMCAERMSVSVCVFFGGGYILFFYHNNSLFQNLVKQLISVVRLVYC